MVALFLFMTVLFFRPPSRTRRTGEATGPGPALPSEAGRGFVEIMRSSDPIAIEVMRGKLAANGIAAEIIGQHTSRMLGYLPVVPLRLMVPRADAALALEIIAGKGAN